MTVNYYPHSLTNQVTEFVRDKGKATLSEVSEKFPEYSKKQLHDALSNARYRKLLKVIFRGNAKSGKETVWAAEIDRPQPVSMEKKKPVASVWQLGTPGTHAWPPAFRGGREFRLLGPWTDPEESCDNRQAA